MGREIITFFIVCRPKRRGRNLESFLLAVLGNNTKLLLLLVLSLVNLYILPPSQEKEKGATNNNRTKSEELCFTIK